MDWGEFFSWWLPTGVVTALLLGMWLSEIDKGIESPIIPDDGRITIGTILKITIMSIMGIYSIGGFLVLAAIISVFALFYFLMDITLFRSEPKRKYVDSPWATKEKE